MKPICIKCERFMRPKKNGVYFVEGQPIGNGVAPGLAEPKNWRPYKLWCGDLWHCPHCNYKTIVGVAPKPIAENHQPEFEQRVAAFCGGDPFLVKDC